MAKTLHHPIDTLCSKRWNWPTIDLSRGTVRACCRSQEYRVPDEELKNKGTEAILNNDYLRERRWEMYQGIRHIDCHSCWRAEGVGLESPREGALDMLIRKQRLLRDRSDELLRAKNMKHIEVQVGSLCDLKCVYCCASNSTRWALEDRQNGLISENEYREYVQQSSPQFREIFDDWLGQNIGTAETLSFVGGEPTMYPELDDLLVLGDHFARLAGNEELSIRIVTNLNCGPERLQKFFSTLRRIEKLGRSIFVDVSMESVTDRAEIIRYGLKWDRFNQNLEQLLNAGLEKTQISFSCTLSALNISSFTDFLVYIAEKKSEYRLPFPLLKNTAHEPRWIAPDVLTPDFQSYLFDAAKFLRRIDRVKSDSGESLTWGYSWADYAEYVEEIAHTISAPYDSTDSSVIEQRSLFFRKMEKMQEVRDFSFLEVFPEYSEFYQYCQNL